MSLNKKSKKGNALCSSCCAAFKALSTSTPFSIFMLGMRCFLVSGRRLPLTHGALRMNCLRYDPINGNARLFPDVCLLFDVASLRMHCMAVISDTGSVVVAIHVTRIETNSAKKGGLLVADRIVWKCCWKLTAISFGLNWLSIQALLVNLEFLLQTPSTLFNLRPVKACMMPPNMCWPSLKHRKNIVMGGMLGVYACQLKIDITYRGGVVELITFYIPFFVEPIEISYGVSSFGCNRIDDQILLHSI